MKWFEPFGPDNPPPSVGEWVVIYTWLALVLVLVLVGAAALAR